MTSGVTQPHRRPHDVTPPDGTRRGTVNQISSPTNDWPVLQKIFIKNRTP